MNALRVAPLRRLLVATLLCGAATLVGAVWILDDAFGRRDNAGPLASALGLVAQQEGTRLAGELDEKRRELDAIFPKMLRAIPAPDTAPIASTRNLCDDVKLPSAVVRAGVVELERKEVLSWLEPDEKGCVDRLWNLAINALTGPPFPAPIDVKRIAQAGMLGMEHAVDGKTVLVAAYRDGVLAHLRFARREGTRAAFMDVKLAELPASSTVKGVRVDSDVTLGGVVLGYAHGGPGVGMVPAAVKRIKAHKDRALTLPDVIDASASRAVLAVAYPGELDGGDLALGVHEVPLEGPLPLKLGIVASAPWPASTMQGRIRLLGLLLLLVIAQLVLLWVTTRKLALALWSSAQRVRGAWMVSHDDVENPDDAERARRLLGAMEQGTQETLHAAFTQRDRYWAAGPLQRLLDVLRKRP